LLVFVRRQGIFGQHRCVTHLYGCTFSGCITSQWYAENKWQRSNLEVTIAVS